MIIHSVGILADFGEFSAEAGLVAILDRLREFNLGPTELKRSVAQLKILSRLRKLDSKIVTTLKTMPIDFDIDVKKDAFYLWGIEEGREEGHEKGLEKGFRLGRLKSADQLVDSGMELHQVSKFLGLDESEILRFINGSVP